MPGVSLILTYYLLLLLVQNALSAGTWPVQLGFWPIHAIFFALGLYLMQRLASPLKIR